MNRRLLITIVAIVLCVAAFLVAVNSRSPWASAQTEDGSADFASTACATQPIKSSAQARTQAMLRRRTQLLARGAFPLERFRQAADASQLPSAKPDDKPADKTVVERDQVPQGYVPRNYVPREEVAFVDPTNYGDRFLTDVNGNPADLEPLVVLHETVGSAGSAISLFQAFHRDDDDQVSYHTLVKRNGTIVYLVPPDKRAFGAGNSVFLGANGAEVVQTNPTLAGSVNNFAYHISLETPSDGNDNGYTHSGYTQAQYQALAWLVAQTRVADERITTHKAVDRSRSRIDPRSFNDTTFFTLLRTQPQTAEIAIRCTNPF